MNPVWLVLHALGGATAIAGGLFLLHVARQARTPRPRPPVYSEQAGGRFDVTNWAVPFVRVAAFDRFVSISWLGQEMVLRRGDVTGIEREPHLLAVGLRLHHRRAELPGILLWPRNMARLEAALRASLAVEASGHASRTT